MTKLRLAAVFLGAAMMAPGVASAQNVAAGQEVFNARCASCHTAGEGQGHRTGPNLFGVVGAPIGDPDNGFRYSDALSGNGGTWTETNLDAWLTSPRNFIPNNRMSFGGLASAQDRADVIAFLGTQK